MFSRVATGQPKLGTYRVTAFTGGTEKDDEFHALVSLGSASNPVGVFRGMSGTITITQSSPDRIVGRYELHAVGFMAADVNDEEREITVRGKGGQATCRSDQPRDSPGPGSVSAGPLATCPGVAA